MTPNNVKYVGVYLKHAVNWCKDGCSIILASCGSGMSKSDWLNTLAVETGCDVYASCGTVKIRRKTGTWYIDAQGDYKSKRNREEKDDHQTKYKPKGKPEVVPVRGGGYKKK